MQTLHRVRDRLICDRTSLMNQMRSLLLERGHIVPNGHAKLREHLARPLVKGSPLTPRIRELLIDMRQHWKALNKRIADLDAEFVEATRADKRTQRLLTTPGIGALNATALVAAVADARTFNRGSDLTAWLGLVPRQATTGGKPRLLGITKRGSRYLRKNLIQGARASLPTLSKSQTRLGAWLRALAARAHHNAAVVALAGKIARIAWALLRHEQRYEATPLAG